MVLLYFSMTYQIVVLQNIIKIKTLYIKSNLYTHYILVNIRILVAENMYIFYFYNQLLLV